MEEAKKSMTHWLIGGILLFVGAMVIVALVIIYSQADSVTTTTEVSNVDPVIDSVFVSSSANGGTNSYTSGIVLTAGTTKTVHVNGVVSDANGATDISQVNVLFYRSAVTDACSTDDNDCYQIVGCTLSNPTSTTKDYNCQVPLQYYADATDGNSASYSAQNWLARVTVADTSSATDIDETNTVEVNTLLALTIPSSITYNCDGSCTNNESTSDTTNEEMTITQQGNDAADVNVSGSDMTCTTLGSIPFGNQEWSLTDVVYESGTDLTGSAVDTDLAVGLQTGSSVTKTLYWNVSVPYNATGTCTGSNTITAIAAAHS